MTLESTVLVVRGVVTHAEKVVVDCANDDAVTRMRRPAHKTVEAECATAVGRLTGRKVIAFASGDDIAPTSSSDSSSSIAPCILQRPPLNRVSLAAGGGSCS